MALWAQVLPALTGVPKLVSWRHVTSQRVIVTFLQVTPPLFNSRKIFSYQATISEFIETFLTVTQPLLESHKLTSLVSTKMAETARKICLITLLPPCPPETPPVRGGSVKEEKEEPASPTWLLFCSGINNIAFCLSLHQQHAFFVPASTAWLLFSSGINNKTDNSW